LSKPLKAGDRDVDLLWKARDKLSHEYLAAFVEAARENWDEVESKLG
jgi:hypothetical protein